MSTIGYRLKKLREKKFPGHGGQTECAKALGVRRQELSRWESGGQNPSRKSMEQIAKLFDVSIDALCGNEKAPGAETPEAKEIGGFAIALAATQKSLSDCFFRLQNGEFSGTVFADMIRKIDVIVERTLESLPPIEEQGAVERREIS